MPILLTSDLKHRAGELLDAAATTPQFFTHNGAVFVLARVDAEDAPAASAEIRRQITAALRAGLGPEEIEHRNRSLRSLDDSEGW